MIFDYQINNNFYKIKYIIFKLNKLLINRFYQKTNNHKN